MVLSPPKCWNLGFFKQLGYKHYWKVLPTQAPDYPYSRSLPGAKVSGVMCSASACDHCWSIEGWIHSQRKNRLDHRWARWWARRGTRSWSVDCCSSKDIVIEKGDQRIFLNPIFFQTTHKKRDSLCAHENRLALWSLWWGGVRSSSKHTMCIDWIPTSHLYQLSCVSFSPT